MRLNSAALALVAAAAISPRGVGGLVIAAKTFTEMATIPLGGACHTPLISQGCPKLSIEADFATNLRPSEGMVIAPSIGTSWTTTITTEVFLSVQ
ncbi:hypothetical protein DOTSEDRAFT_73979 [Dothistroma septosporum NZE10]|uniref:Secreted protein n=1 Tax=Dothistroma septosporum (strain NZE10 / CBS 128990) TaxID=675120 RepID=N1PHC9_DOTSN|nr:hypothetical protein DOTSEDRAFT_73979 [Dothistroma septosporum NZE10]